MYEACTWKTALQHNAQEDTHTLRPQPACWHVFGITRIYMLSNHLVPLHCTLTAPHLFFFLCHSCTWLQTIGRTNPNELHYAQQLPQSSNTKSQPSGALAQAGTVQCASAAHRHKFYHNQGRSVYNYGATAGATCCTCIAPPFCYWKACDTCTLQVLLHPCNSTRLMHVPWTTTMDWLHGRCTAQVGSIQ